MLLREHQRGGRGGVRVHVEVGVGVGGHLQHKIIVVIFINKCIGLYRLTSGLMPAICSLTRGSVARDPRASLSAAIRSAAILSPTKAKHRSKQQPIFRVCRDTYDRRD